MTKDYIPDTDTDFSAWLDNFINTAEKNKAKLNVADAALAELGEQANAFKNSLAEWQAAQVTLDTKQQAKRQARAAAEASARTRVRQIQAEPDVTDAERAALRITLREGQTTPPSAPSTRPVVTVDTAERLRHRLDYRDSATPNRRAKPAGVTGCEIYSFIGPQAPADPSEFRLIAVDPTTPYIVEYTGADAGKTAHYLLRWINARGERGPWSETASATITA